MKIRHSPLPTMPAKVMTRLVVKTATGSICKLVGLLHPRELAMFEMGPPAFVQ